MARAHQRLSSPKNVFTPDIYEGMNVIDLDSSATPNGWKITIALEELQVPYTLHNIDLSAGEQHSKEFLALNPNG